MHRNNNYITFFLKVKYIFFCVAEMFLFPSNKSSDCYFSRELLRNIFTINILCMFKGYTTKTTLYRDAFKCKFLERNF